MTESASLSLLRPFLGVSNSVLGRTWIEELGTALADVAHDHADFSLWFEAGKPKDPLKRISFWWWPKDQ